MWQQRERLGQLNIKLIVISFESGEASRALHEGTEEVGGYYLDQGRTLYRYFGMHQARFWDLWGLQTVWTYLRLIVRGRKLVKSTGDIYQLGGDVLLDPYSEVRFHRIAEAPGDRPDPETIFKLVQEELS
ncbi:MAG: AhpC/TSA family protein [Desulforhopalus sp.]